MGDDVYSYVMINRGISLRKEIRDKAHSYWDSLCLKAFVNAARASPKHTHTVILQPYSFPPSLQCEDVVQGRLSR